MTAIKSAVRRTALFLSVLLFLFALHAEGEETKMGSIPVTLQKSYKKAGENNPLYTQRFGADPGVMEYDGRLYVYMTDDLVEYDADGRVKENSYSKIRTINCISSDDLVNWTDHGKIPVAGYSGIAKWAVNSWAPCAAHKTIGGREKFFLYFCNGGNGIGVLTADSPTGPWRDERGSLLITRAVRNCADVTWLFDPAVMVDEDGTGYLAFGGGIPEGKKSAPGTARIVKLADDMIHLDGDPVRLDVPWLFEDSGINRVGDKYWYTYCSNFMTAGNTLKLTDGAIQYMIADNPLGPYTYMGELFPNEGRFFGIYGNNHHSIASLNGEWYLFYHNRPVEKAMGITGNYRSPQADRIILGEDGLPQQVKGTMKGLSQLKPLDPFSGVSAATMSHQAGITVEYADGQSWIAGDAGSWIRISGVDFGADAAALSVTALPPAGCTLYAVLDDPESEVVSQIRMDVPEDGNPATFSAPIRAEGVHDLYLVTDGSVKLYSWIVK
uniref:Alpha-N-arabinofuranosidase n=1 Tax=uncultured bacterium Contig27 TaxID=1393547 RepID=W0FMD5_9BACT|nr:alpha-N-arabinofuranosidase [uncultured bacterium Contig27]